MTRLSFAALALAVGLSHASATVIPAQPPFQPTPSYSQLAVGASSARVALPTGPVIAIYNTGASAAFVALGSASVTATTSGDQVAPGGFLCLAVGSATYLAAIETGGATSLNISGGSGACSGSGSTPATLPLPTGAAQESGGNLATLAGAVSGGYLLTNQTKLAGTTLTAPTAWGTAPTGNVQGVNASVLANSYFYNVASSTLTRASNTTTYAANTTVCLNTSTTACAPLTIGLGATNAGKGLITRLGLLKSGPTTANAAFTVWLFSAAPGVTNPAQYDGVAYAGPRAGDLPSYIGSATCSTPTASSDSTAQVWYECSLNNPNTSGALVFQALAGSTNINALISVTAAYAPANAETFNVYVSGIY